ncbi:hypothetical protein ABIB56_003056 [Glaciihabitans sp. UYNi722]
MSTRAWNDLTYRACHEALSVAEPEVDKAERLKAKGFEILPDLLPQLVRLAGCWPAALIVPIRADFGDDVK